MCVPKSNSNDRYAITSDVIAYHLVHFVSIRLVNYASRVLILFLLASAQYTPVLWKYQCPVQYFVEKQYTKMKVKLCKVYTLECQQGDEICFRNNKISEFDTLERQTMGVNNMQAHCPWLHAIRKGIITEKKTWRKKIWKYAIVFASTQLRITRLRKYPIDPKAYLGCCLGYDKLGQC